MGIEDSPVQTEVNNIESELLSSLSRNLDFFKEFIPELYKKFANYRPSSIVFSFDNSGELNLKNEFRGGEFVYPRSPTDMCKQGVEAFIQRPGFKVVRARPAEIMDHEDDIHHDTTNKAIALLDQQPIVRNLKPKFYDLLILNGLGIGYVLEELLTNAQVNHLIIIEPNEDIFYASMHILDWRVVFSLFACEDQSKSLNIVVGEDGGEDDVNFALDHHIRDIGIHHAVVPYVLNHLGSPAIDNLIDGFFKRMNFTLSAAGFSDDEIWSLAHTVENWSRNYPLLQKHAFQDGVSVDKPVFILANGPSLDSSIEFIKENRDKAFIISCGSTIGSLMKLGLKPDIHVEMERRYLTYEWLAETTTADYREGITFIGLNTLHPGVFELFENSYMVMKPLDIGSRYCNRFVDPSSGHKCIMLPNCNPTVGNMGVAIASALGFSKVYFFGLDLAMSEDKTHHSKHSTYYDMDEDDEELQKMEIADENASVLEIAGNKAEQVYTTRLFMGAIICVETTVNQSKGYQSYFNASNGAKFRGAKPVELHEIRLGNTFDKPVELTKMMDAFFGRAGLIELADVHSVSSDFTDLTPTLHRFRAEFESPFLDKGDVVERLDGQMRKIKGMDRLGPNASCIHYMLKGSIFYWNLLFMQGLYRCANEALALELVNSIRLIYLEYLDRTIEKCENSVLTIDDKTIGLNEMIKN